MGEHFDGQTTTGEMKLGGCDPELTDTIQNLKPATPWKESGGCSSERYNQEGKVDHCHHVTVINLPFLSATPCQR